MKTWLKKIGIGLAALAGFVLLAALVAVVYALAGYRKTWDVPLPPTRASSDPAVIERGRYLVYGPAQCADCHAPESENARMLAGEEIPLTGAPGKATFLGSWNAPNLTSDTVTGIGAVGDGKLARMMRHGVNREGRIALPFADAYADLSEEDLVAILSYLRTLPPSPGLGPGAHPNLLGKITLAYFLKPYAPKKTPPATVPAGPTVLYGDYLANTVARCESCHTPRNLKTGEFLGPPFSGGLPFASADNPGKIFVTPNLTPDSATGHIANWSEDLFVARLKAGAAYPDSPMPWGSLRRMRDSDLRAIYRYLRSLEPVHRDNGPTLQDAR